MNDPSGVKELEGSQTTLANSSYLRLHQTAQVKAWGGREGGSRGEGIQFVRLQDITAQEERGQEKRTSNRA